MEHTNCLNCSEPIEKKFCPNCGQKSDTHRITIKHFIAHDLLHGVWHIEKGLFFTLKEAIIRPGKAALEYIAGKRVRYYNVFYLALLLIGFNTLLFLVFRHFSPSKISEGDHNMNEVLSAYSKAFILGIVPLLAINASRFFGRWKLNLAEHFIVAGMALLGCLMLTSVFLCFMILTHFIDSGIVTTLAMITFFLIPVSPLWTYVNAFSSKYSFGGMLWRILLFTVLLLLEIVSLLMTVAYFSGQNSLSYDLTAG